MGSNVSLPSSLGTKSERNENLTIKYLTLGYEVDPARLILLLWLGGVPFFPHRLVCVLPKAVNLEGRSLAQVYVCSCTALLEPTNKFSGFELT